MGAYSEILYEREVNVLLTEKEKREKRLEKIKGYCLMDDIYMSKFFEDNIECTQLVLRILLERDDLIVKEVKSQESIKNLQGHSVRLDVLATDSNENIYNIEIQRSKSGAEVKRARYYSSILDSNALARGEDYQKLPNTYVIFITEEDFFELGMPLYFFERQLKGTQKPLGDGSHIVYVNGENKEATPIGKMIQDFWCTNPDDMCYDVLKNKSRELKGEMEGDDSIMDKITQSIIDDEREYIAEDFLRNSDLSVELIAKNVRLPIERVQAIADDLGKQ